MTDTIIISLGSDIEAVQDVVGDASGGLVKQVNDLEVQTSAYLADRSGSQQSLGNYLTPGRFFMSSVSGIPLEIQGNSEYILEVKAGPEGETHLVQQTIASLIGGEESLKYSRWLEVDEFGHITTTGSWTEEGNYKLLVNAVEAEGLKERVFTLSYGKDYNTSMPDSYRTLIDGEPLSPNFPEITFDIEVRTRNNGGTYQWAIYVTPNDGSVNTTCFYSRTGDIGVADGSQRSAMSSYVKFNRNISARTGATSWQDLDNPTSFTLVISRHGSSQPDATIYKGEYMFNDSDYGIINLRKVGVNSGNVTL